MVSKIKESGLSLWINQIKIMQKKVTKHDFICMQLKSRRPNTVMEIGT